MQAQRQLLPARAPRQSAAAVAQQRCAIDLMILIDRSSSIRLNCLGPRVPSDTCWQKEKDFLVSNYIKHRKSIYIRPEDI